MEKRENQEGSFFVVNVKEPQSLNNLDKSTFRDFLPSTESNTSLGLLKIQVIKKI